MFKLLIRGGGELNLSLADKIWIENLVLTSRPSTLSTSKMSVGRDIYFSWVGRSPVDRLLDGRLRFALLTTLEFSRRHLKSFTLKSTLSRVGGLPVIFEAR